MAPNFVENEEIDLVPFWCVRWWFVGEDGSGTDREGKKRATQTTSVNVHKSQMTVPHSSCNSSPGPGASQRQTV